jgi:hypothetical protein
VICAGVGVTLGALFFLACEPVHQRKKIEMTPIGTWQNVPTASRDDGSDSGVTAPNSGTLARENSSCSAAEFDNLEDTLRGCEVPMPRATDVGSLRDRLDVRVATSPSRTTPGGRIDVEITLRNKTNEPLALYFTGDPSPRFDVEALNTQGKRVDIPATKFPGYPKGQKPEARETKAAKVTLEKNGTAKVHLAWDAVKSKWSPSSARSWEGRGYPRVPAGPLAAGRYLLRIVLPLLGDIDPPRIGVDVGS